MSNHGFPDDLTILSQQETWAPLKNMYYGNKKQQNESGKERG